LGTQSQATLESVNAPQFSKQFPIITINITMYMVVRLKTKNSYFIFLHKESPPCVHWKLCLLNALDDNSFVAHYFHKIGKILVALNLGKFVYIQKYLFEVNFLNTFPFSSKLVTIAMTQTLCSNTILQKSSEVSANGPWQAMYSTSLLAP
jgi:hypothetical protein